MTGIFGKMEDVRKEDRVFTVIVSCITLFFAALPLFSVNCINGHDIDYHLLRIEALKTGIVNGLPFLRINMLFFGGEGYASSLFYPDFLLYIPALLRSAGAGINLSYHIFAAFCITAAFITMFFCAYYISENRWGALISAVIYTLCQYHLDDIYTRAAVGEFTAFIFIPLVAAGLYDLTEKDFKRPWFLIAGMAGTLLCHTLTTVFSIIFCLGYVAVKAGTFIKDPKRIIKLMLSALFTVALTAFYWLPVMEQMRTLELKYTQAIFDVDYEKLLIREIFENKAGRMGIAVFLMLFAALLIHRKKDEKIREGDIFAVFGLIFTLCSTGLFPWKRLEEYVSSIQFPWRLFIMSCLMFSLAAGIYISKAAVSKERLAVTAVLAVMAVSAVSNYNRTEEGYYSYSDDYYNEVKFTKNVIGGEWLPLSVTDRDRLIKNRDTAFDENGNELTVERRGNRLTVTAPGSGYIDVPFIYYPGYAAVNAGGKSLSVDGEGDNGRLRVYAEESGPVTVYYGGTRLQHISDIISILAALIPAAVLIISFRSKNSSGGSREGVA